MAPSMKSLPRKHEDLIQVLSTHTNGLGITADIVNPCLGVEVDGSLELPGQLV